MSDFNVVLLRFRPEQPVFEKDLVNNELTINLDNLDKINPQNKLSAERLLRKDLYFGSALYFSEAVKEEAVQIVKRPAPTQESTKGNIKIKFHTELCKKKKIPIPNIKVGIYLSGKKIKSTTSNAKGEALFESVDIKKYTVKTKSEFYEDENFTITPKERPNYAVKDINLQLVWDITMIPEIMSANDWNIGAKLMRNWFSRPSYTYPTTNTNDSNLPNNDNIVTLKWALKYPRVKELYDEMWKDEIYVNDAAKRLIETLLSRNKKFIKGQKLSFGNLSQSANLVNSGGGFYIQNRTTGNIVGALSRDLDGMDAALANFSFRMAVEGEVTSQGTRDTYWGISEEDVYTITIKRVGIYIKDSYDFMDSQTGGLGYWSKEKNEVNKFTGGDTFHEITNQSFRQWRDKNGCGGDFVVFSDMETRAVNKSWEYTQ